MELVQNPRTLILGRKENDDDVKVFSRHCSIRVCKFCAAFGQILASANEVFRCRGCGGARWLGPLLLPVGEADGGLGCLARLAGAGLLVQNWTFST